MCAGSMAVGYSGLPSHFIVQTSAAFGSPSFQIPRFNDRRLAAFTDTRPQATTGLVTATFGYNAESSKLSAYHDFLLNRLRPGHVAQWLSNGNYIHESLKAHFASAANCATTIGELFASRRFASFKRFCNLAIFFLNFESFE